MKLSRPVQIILGVLVLVVLVVVIVTLALPFLQPPPATAPVVEKEAGPTRTPHPWSVSAGPSPTPHPWSIGAGPSPTPAAAATVAAVGGASTSTTPLPQGSGETLPSTDSGLPWLIPVGAVLLLAVVWWRWRRARAESR